MLVINCDGSCRGNPGPGGWGVWAVDKEKGFEKEFYGHMGDTTNNQMELSAAIIAVQLVTTTDKVIIRTDSNYVIKGLTEWIIGWKKNGWRTASKQPVKNEELWKQLDGLRQGKKIEWEWVKGHSNDMGNSKADELANRGTDGEDNYLDFAEFVKELQAGGAYKGRNNTLTDGRAIYIFKKEVKIYPNKKGYLMVDKDDNEVIFSQEDYENLR